MSLGIVNDGLVSFVWSWARLASAVPHLMRLLGGGLIERLDISASLFPSEETILLGEGD